MKKSGFRINVNQRWIIFGALIILVMILELFHSFIGLYYDDYGNASLSYGYDAGVSGLDWKLTDLGSWAGWIYMHFSGRILCGSLLNILIKLGNGPRLFMAIQPLVLTGMFYIIYRIIMMMTEKDESLWTLIGLVALFFVLPDDMYRWNLCWASASVLYIWPLLPFFAVIYLQLILENEELPRKLRIKYTLLIIPCILFTAFSHEQTGLSVAVYLVLYVVWQRIQKNFKGRNLVFSILGVVTYALLFFAPGNWQRLDGNTDFAELSFFEKIMQQYRPLMECLFCKTFIIIYLLVDLILLYYSYVMYKRDGQRKLFAFSFVAFVMIMIIGIAAYYSEMTVILILAIPYLLCMFVCLLIYHNIRKRYALSILLAASAASAFCVLIAPTLPLRCFTEWILVVSIILCELCVDMHCFGDYISLKLVVNGRMKDITIVGIGMLYIGLCIISAKRFGTYSLGYLSNRDALIKDDLILSEYDDETELFLSKLPNGVYAPSMPYDKDLEYIEYWMKQYYDIPNSVSLLWTLNDYVKWKESGDFYSDNWFGEKGTIKISQCPASHVNLRCYVPDDMDCTSISVSVNGRVAETKQLEHGMNEIQVNTNKNGDNNIVVLAKDVYKASNDDKRELSCVLTYYFD